MDNQDEVDTLIEDVKAICELLSSVENEQIKEAITQMHSVPLGILLMLPQNQHIQVKELLEKNFKDLSAALSKLIYAYCTSFNTGFQIAQLPESPPELNVLQDSSNFCVNVYALHKIPEEWYKK
ncbi:phosphatidylinositol 4-phosphate 3-kinase C2 domain-containing subunit gamma-like [Protopterus annectens]|uniref:phosphatidylinositol 4-phosphate 3-kinase C2 domain-containing subunit gamma-like n=1 Tax=Protopterus annectens TaxID=7888 RepID=UPI001CFAA267|nr:phosphatidylinositol 4-phosphate 3-kinase C2 domain-containing subunit gamma-like [Protopterus annectens]